MVEAVKPDRTAAHLASRSVTAVGHRRSVPALQKFSKPADQVRDAFIENLHALIVLAHRPFMSGKPFAMLFQSASLPCFELRRHGHGIAKFKNKRIVCAERFFQSIHPLFNRH
jgi:hypothetical protein